MPHRRPSPLRCPAEPFPPARPALPSLSALTVRRMGPPHRTPKSLPKATGTRDARRNAPPKPATPSYDGPHASPLRSPQSLLWMSDLSFKEESGSFAGPSSMSTETTMAWGPRLGAAAVQRDVRDHDRAACECRLLVLRERGHGRNPRAPGPLLPAVLRGRGSTTLFAPVPSMCVFPREERGLGSRGLRCGHVLFLFERHFLALCLLLFEHTAAGSPHARNLHKKDRSLLGFFRN